MVLHTWRVVGRVVAGRSQIEYEKVQCTAPSHTLPDNVHQLHVQQPSTYAKPEAASAVLGSSCWAACGPKHVELHINIKSNFDTLLHLVGFFYMNYFCSFGLQNHIETGCPGYVQCIIISSNICPLCYTICDIYHLLHVSASRCHPQEGIFISQHDSLCSAPPYRDY